MNGKAPQNEKSDMIQLDCRMILATFVQVFAT